MIGNGSIFATSSSALYDSMEDRWLEPIICVAATLYAHI